MAHVAQHVAQHAAQHAAQLAAQHGMQIQWMQLPRWHAIGSNPSVQYTRRHTPGKSTRVCLWSNEAEPLQGTREYQQRPAAVLDGICLLSLGTCSGYGNETWREQTAVRRNRW